MAQLFFDTLDAFGFTQMQSWIVLACLLAFLCNLLGGMLYSISRAYFGAITPRKLSERISFRLFLLSELFLLVFAVYYHSMLIESIHPAHVVFWFSALLISPLLAVIGSQSMYLLLSKRIDHNIQAGKRRKTAARDTGERKNDEAHAARNEPPTGHKNPAHDYLHEKRKPR